MTRCSGRTARRLRTGVGPVPNATGHEHLAIGQQGGRVACARRRPCSPVAVQDPPARVIQLGGAIALPASPPVTSTLPSGSSVAVWVVACRNHAPGGRSRPRSSGRTARRRPAGRLRRQPPATSTLPSGSSVAVWPFAWRNHAPDSGPRPAGRVVELGGGQRRLAGPVASSPPVTSTLPSGSRVAVWTLACRRVMLPAEVQVPVTRVVQLGGGQRATGGVAAVAARHEDLAIEQQRGRMGLACRDHAPGGGPRPAAWVVQLGGGQQAARGSGDAARHEDLAAGQHGGRAGVAISLDHPPGGGPRGRRGRWTHAGCRAGRTTAGWLALGWLSSQRVSGSDRPRPVGRV